MTSRELTFFKTLFIVSAIWNLIGAIFGAVGTAGQRCTTTRRLIIHESIYDSFTAKLVKAYEQLKIGDALTRCLPRD